MVLNHVMFAVASVAASKRFYLEAFAPLGYKVYYETESTVGLADANGVPDLWLRAVKDGEVPAKDFHIAFSAQSRQQVNQFYEAALKAGGKDNGAPGIREFSPTYYAAFAFDLDGNNIEVVHT